MPGGRHQWPADFATPNWPEFERVFWSNTGCFAVIDEAPTVSTGDYRPGFRKCLMAGRHQGHAIAIIGQRPTAIDANARGQCSAFRVFRIGKTDSENLANEIAAPAVAEAHQLAVGEYFEVEPDGTTAKKRVF